MFESVMKKLQTDGDVASIEVINADISLYSKLKANHGSAEGLNNIASRVMTGIADFLFKIVLNLKTAVTGIFKNIKRSELQAFVDRHRLAVKKLEDTGYSTIYKKVIPYLPFTAKPKVVAEFCDQGFKTFNITTRLENLVDLYMRLALSIKHNEIEKSVSCLRDITTLNDQDAVKAIYKTIEELVIVRLPKRLSTIGDVFDSTSELVEAYKLILANASELDTAIDISNNQVENLYRAFETLRDALIEADAAGYDVGRLKGIISEIENTGDLINTYAILVREYHHLEHWMTECLDAVK